ncbi:MAG: DUF5106 domain-containing protein [Muribaculaceae bacterium]|nr:DUF5106 domain-containing protein [Muribaculaceae bacterium]
MKKLFLYIFSLLAVAPCIVAADGDLFPYPVPPTDMVRLDERCDFLVSRFWRSCDLKSAMSKRDKLNATFGDWISFMPYANADTVHVAIERLLSSVSKSGPLTLELAQMAEGWVYSDTSEIFSEEIYYPFAKAAAEHKKISGAERARFENQVRIMENSGVGKTVGTLEYTTVDGKKGSINDVHTQMIVVMFNDHDCDACTLARVRLSADINANALIRNNLLSVLCIEPNAASEEWKAAAAGFPQEWTVGCWEDADEYFSINSSPTIYLLNSRHKVLAKNVRIDDLLSALAAMRQQAGL